VMPSASSNSTTGRGSNVAKLLMIGAPHDAHASFGGSSGMGDAQRQQLWEKLSLFVGGCALILTLSVSHRACQEPGTCTPRFVLKIAAGRPASFFPRRVEQCMQPGAHSPLPVSTLHNPNAAELMISISDYAASSRCQIDLDAVSYMQNMKYISISWTLHTLRLCSLRCAERASFQLP
jgi:hypothetical protein